jgi:amino acid adenylation domain-containing protein
VTFEASEIEQSITTRFEAQVRVHGNRTAVRTDNLEVSYESLNAVADRVAAAILAKTDGQAHRIAVLLEKGELAIATILGALKSGQCYVPLDPSHPRERLEYITRDSQAALILTSTQSFSLACSLVSDTSNIINVERLGADDGAENIDVRTAPDAPAWIIYTSGSTGKPKGVVQTHRNVLHFVMNYTNGFHLTASDRVALLWSPSVNAGAHEIFLTLLNGASLHPLDLVALGADGVIERLRKEKITIYSSAATTFQHLFAALPDGELLSDVRLVRLGSEPVYKRHFDLYKRCFSDRCVFANRLGSTETGSILWYFMDPESIIEDTVLPVGYPVQDNEVLLLDDERQPVNEGEIGEIAVRSRYVSPGYWRQPARTEAVFLPDPEDPRSRIYLTGDLGRVLPDGRFVCLGRKDYRLKIRGYPVEPGEVEHALLDIPTVKAAFVAGRRNDSGDDQIVAYVVPEAQPAPAVGVLREALGRTLPDFMIPSAFVWLDALPLAPNGKVDRSALPSPEPSRPDLQSVFVGPRTELETALAKIWTDILQVDTIGIDDNFLELGGDSLRAMRLVNRVRDVLKVDLDVIHLLEAPTIRAMAKIVAAA